MHFAIQSSMKTTNKTSALFNFHRDQEGATSVEYAIMLALIAAVCVVAITSVGGEAGSFWSNNSDEIANAFSK